MKIIFFGTPNFAQIILGSLIVNKKFEVINVVTNPDKPAGRSKILSSSPVKQTALKNSIEVLQPNRLNDADFFDRLKNINAGLYIIAAYGKIIPKKILDLPKYGCVNVHGSILPEYRGPSPIQFVLMNGKKETGISIMLMDEGMDTGPILSQKKIIVEENDNFISLSEKMAHLGAAMIDEILPQWISGKISPSKQENDKATYTRLFKTKDYEIDWEKTAEEIQNQIRSLYPHSYGIVSSKNNLLRIKILESQKTNIENSKNLAAGNIAKHNKMLLSICGNGSILQILKIQPEGKRAMTDKDFINGYNLADL